jgi:hypothetical protein
MNGWIDMHIGMWGGGKGQITLECRDPCLLENGADVFGFLLCLVCAVWVNLGHLGPTWLHVLGLCVNFVLVVWWVCGGSVVGVACGHCNFIVTYGVLQYPYGMDRSIPQ